MLSIFFNYFFGLVISLGMLVAGFMFLKKNEKSKSNNFVGYSTIVISGILFLWLLIFGTSLTSRVNEYRSAIELDASDIKKIIFVKEDIVGFQFIKEIDVEKFIVDDRDKLEEFLFKFKMNKDSFGKLGPHTKWNVQINCKEKDFFFTIYDTSEKLFISFQMKKNGGEIGWYENKFLKSYMKNIDSTPVSE